MDRYLAWLIADEKLNPNAEVPEIFRSAHPKLVATGFAVAALITLFFASLGYIIYD